MYAAGRIPRPAPRGPRPRAARGGAGAAGRRCGCSPGAGTGKTRAITHRIAYGVATGVYNPSEVLAVTFTTRAAGEMRTRLRSLGAGGVQARTFHSAALRQARYFWPKVYGGELPTLIDSKLPMIGNAARRNRVDIDQATLRDLAARSSGPRSATSAPTTTPRSRPPAAARSAATTPATVARVFATYEDVKRDQGRMDMEDVLLCAAALLSEDERVAAQVRRQYRWFVVDEFQDVSPIQAALLDLWLGGRHDLCVVGDPAQTIYSFAGASPTYLTEFRASTPPADLRRAGPQLPLHPADRRHRQPAAGRHDRAPASQLTGPA